MRIWMTGGTGFVGSNIVRVAVSAGHHVTTTAHSYRPTGAVPYAIDVVDMTDASAVAASIELAAPEMIIHCAILNDQIRMYGDRLAAWDAYVTSTRTVARAAERANVAMILVSSDWVFDGTQVGADENTPPNPVNLYGVLKLASEMVTLERGGSVARVSGVNGMHYARPTTPRQQDAGFGYFVASLVDSLRDGHPFAVWMADDINMVATPSLASECAEMILQIGTERLDGIFHCCGADSVGRMDLAIAACHAFGLDESLLASGPPPRDAFPPAPIPRDTSLTSPRTARLLRRTPSTLPELLKRFRVEYDSFVSGR